MLAIKLIEEANQNGCSKVLACGDLGIDQRTFSRWKSSLEDKRKGALKTPSNKLSEEEREEVIKIANSEEYRDLTPSQIVPRLADKGTYIASESTFYRILKEEKMLTHRGKSKAPSYEKPMPLIAHGPNEIYSWDITYLKSSIKGRYYFLYMFMDVFSRKIVGFDVFENELSEHAAEVIKKIYKEEGLRKDQVVLHSDNGGPMKGAIMLSTLQSLGVIPSFSRPRVSDDNPYSESLFRTLKYCPTYPNKPFESIEGAKQWVEDFVYWYNEVQLHSGINFVTPSSRHELKDKSILKRREIVYETARVQNPNRWSKKTRNWKYITEVPLNYLQKNKKEDIEKIAS